MNGGYSILNLHGVDFTEMATPYHKVGIYERLESMHGKPLLVSGITIGGIVEPDRFVTVDVQGTDFIINCGVYVSTQGVAEMRLTVDDEDNITYTSVNFTK